MSPRRQEMVKRVVVAIIIATFLVGALWAGGRGEGAAAKKGPITVGSKIDTEGGLLGQMIVQLLRENGFEVVDKVQFGTTAVVREAIINGELDIYPEYTGNGGFFFEGTDPSIWKDPQKGYMMVKKRDLAANDIVWLQPASANNTWAVAIRKDLAESEGIDTWDDFAKFVQGGGQVKLAGSEEFVNRPDALPAFEEAYGFELGKDQLLILSGGNTATTMKAAAERTDGVNAAMTYGTDGQLPALGLKVLEDTKNVQPVYQPTPIIRKEVIDVYPEIGDILRPVFRKLDLETLQTLNSKIAVEGMSAAAVAEEFLKSEGFAK
jgi:osmoprotectant transport system substrate-binding protein